MKRLMTNQQHSITPPPELRRLWAQQAQRIDPRDPMAWQEYVATQAARWGADQELLACGNYLEKCASWEPEDVTELLNHRRPRPPSLKEQALKALDDISIASFEQDAANTIRHALEQLDD